MLFVLTNQSPQPRRSSVQQYPRSDPIQERFRHAFGRRGGDSCVWALDLRECWLLCLFLFSNYSPPPLSEPSQISALFFFLFSFPPSVFLLLLPVAAHHGFRISPAVPCTCVTAHIPAGARLLFSERAPISLYNIQNRCSLWLHGLNFFFFFCARVWIFESKNYKIQLGRNCTSPFCLELAAVHALSQMNGH